LKPQTPQKLPAAYMGKYSLPVWRLLLNKLQVLSAQQLCQILEEQGFIKGAIRILILSRKKLE
jgi:hypothetical protein